MSTDSKPRSFLSLAKTFIFKRTHRIPTQCTPDMLLAHSPTSNTPLDAVPYSESSRAPHMLPSAAQISEEPLFSHPMTSNALSAQSHRAIPEVRDPETLRIISLVAGFRADRSVLKDVLEHRVALCQKQVLALSTKLVAMEKPDTLEVDRNIEAFRDALKQRGALQEELAVVKRELQEAESSIEALRESIIRAAAIDGNRSTRSLLYSSNSALSSGRNSSRSSSIVDP